MIYLFEGVDVGGKSTLIKSLISKLIDEKRKFIYIHSTKEDMNDKCVYKTIETLRELKNKKDCDIIFDRHFISNLIYQEIFQDGDFVSYNLCKQMIELIDVVILAIPNSEKYFDNFEKVKKTRHENYDVMDKVYQMYCDLWDCRNNGNIIDGKKVFKYDMFEYENNPSKFIEEIGENHE